MKPTAGSVLVETFLMIPEFAGCGLFQHNARKYAGEVGSALDFYREIAGAASASAWSRSCSTFLFEHSQHHFYRKVIATCVAITI